jgi:myo-inositol 2-dehydrogenase / D-chiro-inositol 1-dehydrogenase
VAFPPSVLFKKFLDKVGRQKLAFSNVAISLGVIGTGNIGQDHIRRITQLLSGGRVVAVTDIDSARAQKIAKDLGGRAEATGQKIIEAEDIDAVVVTSIGSTHEEYVLAAIAAGKPVFCEKPLATTAAACKRIIDAEVAVGKRLVQVGFMRRYDTGYRLLREVITKGVIGAPLMAHCAHRNPAVGDSYTTDMAITDTVIHEIDTMRWLLDDEYVSAQVLHPRKTSKASNHLADPQIVLLETANGIRIDVEVFVNAVYGYDIQCEVVGETGVARLPEPPNVQLRREGKLSVEILTDWKKRFIGAYDVELQEWIHSVASGKIAGPSSWDGYAAAVTADACVEAQKTGKIVEIRLGTRPALYRSDGEKKS